MSEPKKLYEVGQTIHHGDNVLECVGVREEVIESPTTSEHQHYSYIFRDQKELDAEREAADAARTGFEDAPAQIEETVPAE